MDKEIEDMAAAIRTNMEITERYIVMVSKLFTRADIETLEEAIYLLHGPKMDALRGVEEKLDLLKERIHLLIPPTDGTQ